MTTAIATKGIHDILYKFTLGDLQSLVTTVTHGLLNTNINNQKEAIEVIIKYSPDVLSILRRQKVTREILFQYVHENNIPVSVPITKGELIEKIRIFWNISGNSTTITENNTPTTEIKSNNINLLAEKFSEWFFDMLNQPEPIGKEHFFADSKLNLNLISGNEKIHQTIENNIDDIVQQLFITKTTHNLYFNPNLTNEGVQGRMDPHGLVIVLVCGTLHINNVCAGVFEQVFSLARDPFSDNNWKIKCIDLNLRSKMTVNTPPCLQDSDLTCNLLSLPSS